MRRTVSRGWIVTTVRDALLVVLICTGLALLFNVTRRGGLPLIAEEAYEILVPCPEPVGEVDGMAPDDGRLTDPATLLIDARSGAAFHAWQAPGARHVAFDYLDPTPQEEIRQIASSGARQVAVYGDGEHPDSGHQLAREIAGQGIRNIYYVRGGAPALRAAEDRRGSR